MSAISTSAPIPAAICAALVPTIPPPRISTRAGRTPVTWAEFLQRAVEENTGADAELMLADIIEARDGSEAAQVYITRQLQRHPTMRVFHKLMDYHLNEAEEGRAKESLMVLRDMVGEKVRSKPRYRCQKCGFTAYTLYWHCPSCRAWSTIKPIRGLDGL